MCFIPQIFGEKIKEISNELSAIICNYLLKVSKAYNYLITVFVDISDYWFWVRCTVIYYY